MLANEIICCLNKAICFKSIHPTGTKNTSTLFYKQNFVSIFMISFDVSLFEKRCCKLTFSFWPISVHFNNMVPEMERTKEVKLWKENLAGNAERRTTCILSCRSGELKVLWFKCVPFLYVFTNDSINVQVATSLFHYVFDKDTQSLQFVLHIRRAKTFVIQVCTFSLCLHQWKH